MADLNPAIREMFLYGLPSGGGVDRNQAEPKGALDCQPGGAEFPLDQNQVAGLGNTSQPGEDRGKIAGQAVDIRRHLRPDHPNVFGRFDDSGDSERGAGILFLPRRQPVVEEEDEGGGR